MGCPFKVTEGTTDTCGLHFHSVTVSHPISHFSGDPKLRRCQNQPSVTATQKVCYIELILWTQHIQSVKIDYVTTDISAGQEDTASLLSCFCCCCCCPYPVLPPSGAWFCPGACRTKIHNNIHVRPTWRSSIIFTGVILLFIFILYNND